MSCLVASRLCCAVYLPSSALYSPLQAYRRWGTFAPGSSIAASAGCEWEARVATGMPQPVPASPADVVSVVEHAVDVARFNGNVDLHADGMYLATIPCRRGDGVVTGVVQVLMDYITFDMKHKLELVCRHIGASL